MPQTKYKTGCSDRGQTSDTFITHFSVQDRSTMLKQRRRLKKNQATHHNLFYGHWLIFKSDLQGRGSKIVSKTLLHWLSGSRLIIECQSCNNYNCFGRQSYCKIIRAYSNSKSNLTLLHFTFALDMFSPAQKEPT